jgi:mono/diheme cytochrome c family protein
MMRHLLKRLVLLGTALLPLAAPATADSAAQDFLSLCAPCHGADGRGNGPAAAALKTRPADLTRITARYGAFPAEKITQAVMGLDMPESHGSREMPIWGDRLINEALGDETSVAAAKTAAHEVEDRIAALVRYLERIQVTD